MTISINSKYVRYPLGFCFTCKEGYSWEIKELRESKCLPYVCLLMNHTLPEEEGLFSHQEIEEAVQNNRLAK